jgi:hypothetical protein
MKEMKAKSVTTAFLTGAALLAATGLRASAQQAQADCRGSLEAYLGDHSFQNRTRLTANSISFTVNGVKYICTCYANNQPPDCRKEGSSGSGGMSGVDMSTFSPGQQIALMATQSLLQGLFAGIFSSPSKPAGPSPEEILRQQQELLRKQEEERQQALDDWNAFQQAEAKRIETERAAARANGEALLGQMGSSAGQGLGFESVGGQGLEFQSWVAEKPEAKPAAAGKHPAPTSAAEQARCAADFSDEALKLSKAGKREEAEFMSLQAQKAMSGEPTDVPCPGAASVPASATAGTGASTPAVDVNAVLELYNARIQDLFALSQKLADVRKQKIDAQIDFRQAEARIAEAQAKSATVTAPEEKKEVDDLLGELEALKADAENRQKIAEENENACLADAKKAEDAVKELDAKLKSGQDRK